MSEAELLVAALALPRKERADMALRLVESLDDSSHELSPEEWDRAALQEYRDRRASHLAGDVQMTPAAEGLAAVKARLARGR